MTRPSETSIGGAGERFPDTQWSIIQEAIRRDSPDQRARLDDLIRRYWKPVYALIRRSFGSSIEDAKDLTQEFFTRFLDGRLLGQADRDVGSFRNFVMAAVRNYVKDQIRDARALKRGGGQGTVSIEEGDVEQLMADFREATPEEIFDRAWAKTVIDLAMERTEESLAAEGKKLYFDVFRLYESEADRDPPPTYQEIARRLGISHVDVKNHLTCGRHRFRESLIRIVRDYVSSGGDVMDEINRLF